MPGILLVAIGLAALSYISQSLLGPAHGLQAEYLDGERPGGKPAIAAVDDNISTAQLQARWYDVPPDQFSVTWFGYITIVSPGSYRFALTSDDAAFLSVDGNRLIDNGGRHGPLTATGEVTLARGLHPVLIEFTQYGGDYAIDWQWAPKGVRLTPVPAWALTPFRVSLWRVIVGRILEISGIVFAAIAFVLVMLVAWRGRARIAQHGVLATLVLYVALAIAHTWPLATDPAHLTRHDNRDTMLNEWIVAWVAHQAVHDPLHLFDGNIFYPERDTLAYSEAMLPQAALGAPLLALGASPVLTYSVLLIAGLALSGWSMCLVIRKWTDDWSAGVVSGAIFAFNAHVLTRVPHLQAQHVEFLPPALLALDALLRQPGARRAGRLALWAALQATTSVYFLVLTFFAILAGILARPKDWSGDRFLPFARGLGVATGLSALVLVPFLLPYYHANHDQGLTRSLSDAAQYAATWKDYLSTSSRIFYPWWSYRFFFGTALFPGAVGLALSGVAVVRGDAFRDPRARMCLAIGIVGVALSFGPHLPGYSVLYGIVPVLRAIRATARFGYLATVAVGALAGFGVVALKRITPARAWPALAIVLLAAATAESLVAPLGLRQFDGIPPIYAHLPHDPGTRVVEIPFFGPRSWQFHAGYMLDSTANWQPIVNGYSGFAPASFFEHAGVLQGFPDEPSMALLRTLGITHVFVNTTLVSPETLAMVKARHELSAVETFGAITLYRVRW